MKIAVIILNYNSNADCRKCIGYLKAQQGVRQEIIVVDNCSRDDDRNAVEVLCKEQGCTFIANNENRGYNAGNNVGLRYAAEKGYEFALIANPDMEFQAASLNLKPSRFSKSSYRPRARNSSNTSPHLPQVPLI